MPIPINPLTGKAFGYQLDGKTAVLNADGPPEAGWLSSLFGDSGSHTGVTEHRALQRLFSRDP